VLWRRKRLWGLVAGGIVFLTLIWAFSVTPVYKATSKVFIKMQDTSAGLSSIVPASMGKLEFTSSGNAADTVIEMIDNKDSLDDVISDLKLMKGNGLPFSSLELLNPGFLKLSVNKTGVQVAQITNSDIIEISGFSKYPALAVKISDTVTKNTLKAIGNINRDAVEHTIAILTQETSRLKQLIADSEETIKNYKINNEAVNLDEKISTYTTQFVSTELSIIKMSVEKKEDHPDLKAALRQIAYIKNELKTIPEKQFELSDIQRINTSINSVYTTLLSDLEKAKVLKALSITNMLVIEKAKIPNINKKYYIYFPKKKLMLILALVIGGFLGVITVFFVEYLDDTIKNPDELKMWTGQKVLASIPELKEIEIFPPKDTSPILKAVNDLWLSIIMDTTSQENKKKHQVLTVTSYGEKEGKSLVVAYLGFLLSKNGIKTLIIDFNLSNPSLSQLYKINDERLDTERGLPDFIADARASNTAGTKVFNKLDDHLYFLPNGFRTEQHISLIKNSLYMSNAIELAKNEFDMILIDSSPLSKGKEPLFMASKSDAAILVVEACKYQIENILWSIQSLNESGAVMAGVVLNKQYQEEIKRGIYKPHFG
jgi:tyrosine-protein kinase Etk/Wzc